MTIGPKRYDDHTLSLSNASLTGLEGRGGGCNGGVVAGVSAIVISSGAWKIN